MRIPASKLLDLLDPAVPVSLRDPQGRLLSGEVVYADAVAAVVRGEVEGVASPSGRVRFLQQLSDAEMQKRREASAELSEDEMDETSARGSSGFAAVHLGVYRQAVRQSIVVEDPYGRRVVVASGEIVGHVYAHCGLRGL